MRYIYEMNALATMRVVFSSAARLSLVMFALSGPTMAATARSGHLEPRAPTQSEQAQRAGGGNLTIAIACAASVAGIILLLLITFKVYKWYQKKEARNGPGQPEMAQTSLLAPTTAAAAARRPRRPRAQRQASTRTVPEYSEQAGDEEMVLNKSEFEEVRIEGSPVTRLPSGASHSEVDAHFASTATYSQRRTSYAASGVPLNDIENPAPELRLERVDTIQTGTAPSITSSSESGHRPLMNQGNESTLTLDETSVEAALLSSSGGPSSFFASPAYVNRSRSRSIDISRTMSSTTGEENSADSRSSYAGARPSLDLPQSRRSSGFLSIFPRRQSNLAPTLPVHQPITDTRREALRNREISAPLSDTLVRSSYTYPKAGINPVQAAWLGSRDHIARLATYLDTAPPAFAEADESLEMGDRSSLDASSSNASRGDASASVDEAPVAHSSVLAQMEEESAQLSSLVHQESMRRASLPAHMVALPPSAPGSPISPSGSMGNADWPISRAASIARVHSLARHRASLQQSPLERQTSLARRRMHSGHRNDSITEVDSTDGLEQSRSESPSPLSRTLNVNVPLDLTARPALVLDIRAASE